MTSRRDVPNFGWQQVAKSTGQQHHSHFLLQIRQKGDVISLIVLLSHAALLEMCRPHFDRQVIHLDAVINLTS